MTQTELIFSYYQKNPNRDIPHQEIVDWAVNEWAANVGTVLRDPDRAIRKLAQEGKLIKVAKGVYRYDPDHVAERILQDFTATQKKIILERDNYQCVVCGRGRANGVELHVDHIRPKDFGGRAEIDNGETLCAQHNFQKKNYGQTELGKKMFIRLYELSKASGDIKNQVFAAEVLASYSKHNIDSHITWSP